MRISEIKLIHLIVAIIILLWAYLFFDWQKTKYQLGFIQWQGQVTGAINNLDGRIKSLEVGSVKVPTPNPEPKIKK